MVESWYMKKKILTYDVVFEEQGEGGYTVTVPSLPGCITEGDNFEKAKANIEDAIKLYLEDQAKDGEEITSRRKSVFLGQIEVNLNSPVET